MKTLKRYIKDGKFYYVNSNITEENFPKPKSIRTENWKIIRMRKPVTSQEALDEIKKQGCTPANVYELLEWRETHGDELKDNEWALAFGSEYTGGGGYHRVPLVYRSSDGGWGFHLGDFGHDWYDGYCFVCFCDLPLKSQTLDKTQELRLLELEKFKEKVEKMLKLD